jgi:origin recognition complex subunit 2
VLFLIIHNIDGAALRADKTQQVLSLLARVRGIHIMASVDHVNAPLSMSLVFAFILI